MAMYCRSFEDLAATMIKRMRDGELGTTPGKTSPEEAGAGV